MSTVHFLISTWSLSIAVRISPEGTGGTFIVKLFSQVLTVVFPPAGWILLWILRASLLHVTEYTKRFVANINRLKKEGCKIE